MKPSRGDSVRSIDDTSWEALGKGYVYPDENLSPAINQAITLISGAIAALRPTLMHIDPTGKRRLVDVSHPVWMLLKKPCSWLSWSEFVSEIIRDTLLHGNSYVVIKDDQLIPVDHSGVQCRTGSTQLVYHVTYNFPKQTSETVSADKILHYRSSALDSFRACGVPPLDRTNSLRELAMEMSKAVISGYKQGVYPSLLVQMDDQKLSDEDTARLYQQTKNRFKDSFGKPMIVGSKITVSDVKPASNRQAQMVESRSYLVSEVARVFNISETLLNRLDNATLANVREYTKQFHTFTLKPHIARFEQTFTNGLLEDDIHLVLDQREFTEGDTLERRKSVLELRKAKIITAKEAREMLDLSSDDEEGIEALETEVIENERPNTVDETD